MPPALPAAWPTWSDPLAALIAGSARSERSGRLELDAVIADFAAGTWARPIESIGGRRFPVADLRVAGRAAGRCKSAAMQFARFADSRQLSARAERFILQEIGYPHSNSYADHWLVVISDEQGEPYAAVDWTASQFGLTEFPLVLTFGD
jgi:hypothetical protein